MSDEIFKKLQLQQPALQQVIRDLYPLQNVLSEQARIADAIAPLRTMLGETAVSGGFIKDAIDQHGLMARDFSTTVFPEGFTERFRLPDEALKAIQLNLVHPDITDILSRYHLDGDNIGRAIAAMKSPWLDLHNQLGSLAAMTELHGIGHALATMPSFNGHLTDALRADLGDWRTPLSVNLSTLLDPTTRSEFYIARGFDPGLTDFPVPALRSGLVSAGLYERSDDGIPDQEEGDEVAFMRTNEAHNRLMRFEYHLRRFIDDAMQIAVGPDWIKHRVPEQIRTNWEIKKAKSTEAGEIEHPLIAYADFPEYLVIITRRDNWKQVFGEIFQHKPSVEESFRRLYPVRNCTMHARPITSEDALFLLVELKRLSKAIGFEL